MTKSITLAALLAATLGACSWMSPPPPANATTPDTAVNSLKSAFVPYCGPIWSVGKQGYQTIPCPPGSNYLGASVTPN
jgi:hypothetical protein